MTIAEIKRLDDEAPSGDAFFTQLFAQPRAAHSGSCALSARRLQLAPLRCTFAALAGDMLAACLQSAAASRGSRCEASAAVQTRQRAVASTEGAAVLAAAQSLNAGACACASHSTAT